MSEKPKKPAAFSKQQFLASRQRPGLERDILAAVLEDDKSYTITEADKLIDEFLNKEAR